MTESLYPIRFKHQSILNALEAMIESGDWDQSDLDQLNEELKINADEFAPKAQAYADTISAKLARAAYLKSESDRLLALMKKETNGANRLHEEISQAMQLLGIEKTQLERNDLSFRTSESVYVSIDPKLLPIEYQRMKVVIEADKTALKKAIKANEINIEGVTLIERQNLQIK